MADSPTLRDQTPSEPFGAAWGDASALAPSANEGRRSVNGSPPATIAMNLRSLHPSFFAGRSRAPSPILPEHACN